MAAVTGDARLTRDRPPDPPAMSPGRRKPAPAARARSARLRRRLRRRAGDDRLPHAAALVAGAVLAASVFLPWYSPSLSEPFTPDPATGWTATIAARAVLLLALIIFVAAGLLGLDRARQITLSLPALRLAGTVGVGAAAIALALVLYRFVVLPDTTGLLARDWGIFVALFAAAVALLATAVLKFVEND